MRKNWGRRARRARGRRLLVAAALGLGGGAKAVEVTPVYRISILGGQYFLQSQNHASLSGNASAVAAPVLNVSERWQLIPMMASNYNGTKGTGDGVGAGTLFQQQMDHRASLAAVYSVADTNWRLKPTMSYKRYFLKETLDETWGKGLFDWEKIQGGFEIENVYKDPFSYRLGFDFYRIRFPSYQSLEAQAKTDPNGNPLNRELASRNVLDTYNYQITASATRPWPYDNPFASLSASYSLLYQDFIDQRIVDQRGQIQDHKPYDRQDFLQTFSLTAAFPRRLEYLANGRWSTALNVNASHNGSNQNTFDAARTRFLGDAYSYWTVGGGPSYQLAWGDEKRPTSVGAGFQYTRTTYTGRLAQNSDGIYLSESQYQARYVASLSATYPIAAGFNLKGQTNWLWAASNQRFEKTYLYTYRTANYLFGVTYEY